MDKQQAILVIGINSEDMIINLLSKNDVDIYDPEEESSMEDIVENVKAINVSCNITDMINYVTKNNIEIVDEIQYVLY